MDHSLPHNHVTNRRHLWRSPPTNQKEASHLGGLFSSRRYLPICILAVTIFSGQIEWHNLRHSKQLLFDAVLSMTNFNKNGRNFHVDLKKSCKLCNAFHRWLHQGTLLCLRKVGPSFEGNFPSSHLPNSVNGDMFKCSNKVVHGSTYEHFSELNFDLVWCNDWSVKWMERYIPFIFQLKGITYE